MSAEFVIRNQVIRRDHAARYALHDHAIRRAEARRRQAEAIADGIHSLWTRGRRALQRLINWNARESRPVPNSKDKEVAKSLGRASVAEALRRDRVRLRRLFRRLVLEPLARSRRRRAAIDHLKAMDDRLLADIGLMRGQIELAVDGNLERRREILPRLASTRPSPIEGAQELPLAA